jgi:hypothetical protein
MSPIKAADPQAQILEAGVAEAAERMKGIVRPQEPAAPPEVDREAPHGRDDQGAALAPHGYNKDGSVSKTGAGRKSKDDQARTVPAGTEISPPAQGNGNKGPALESQDFSAGLMQFSETVWFGGSVAAKLGPQVPLVGRLIPGRKLAATMAVFDDQRPALCAALNLAAQHDLKARRLAARLAEGEASWALTCMFMVAPFTAATAAVWQGDNALAEQELPGLDELARRNEDALDRMFAKVSGQMEAAQLAMQAAAAEAMAGAPMNGQEAPA